MEKHYTKKYTKVSGNRYSNNLAYLNDYESPWHTTESSFFYLTGDNNQFGQIGNDPYFRLLPLTVTELTIDGKLAYMKYIVSNKYTEPTYFSIWPKYGTDSRDTYYYTFDGGDKLLLEPGETMVINVPTTLDAGVVKSLVSVRFTQVDGTTGQEVNPYVRRDLPGESGSRIEMTPLSGLYMYGGYDLNGDLVLQDEEVTYKYLMIESSNY